MKVESTKTGTELSLICSQTIETGTVKKILGAHRSSNFMNFFDHCRNYLQTVYLPNCLPLFIDQKYKFHLITSDDFENLAAIVLEDKYKRPFLVFKEGRDGGIDCEASNIGMLTNDKIIVQVKHTSNESETLKDGTRRSVFEKEKSKVERLVKDKKLDTYVIFTNYQVPAGQSDKLRECFNNAGVENVEVVGYETLCMWLTGSPSLKATLIASYPVINLRQWRTLLSKAIITALSEPQTKTDYRRLSAQNLSLT